MSADISAILDDLAAGRITAEEARRRIDAAQSDARVDRDAGADRDSGADGDAGADGDNPADGDAGSSTDGEAPDAERQPWAGTEDWRSKIPPEAREGLRSAWNVVSGVAGTVAGAASGSAGRGPGPRRAAQTSSPTTPPRAGEEAESVSLHCTGKRVHVVADETVSGVQVDGGHTRRRVGRVVEVTIEGHLAPDLSNLLRLQVPKGIDDVKDLSLGREVMVRVNPGLCLSVEISGGSLHCEGVARVGSLRVTAGAAEIDGVHEVRDGLVQAAAVSVSGPIDTGRSRLRVESGNLTVNLDPQSNVSVRAAARTGVVSWPESGEVDEYVVGNGSARMDISVVLGRAAIRHR